MDDVPLPKFRLSLLGRFELTGLDGPVELPSKKLAGLLAYLALAPQPQSREKLAALLWGSHFDAQARQNLRQALFRLRRVLGEDVLIGDGEEIALAPGVIDCDATRMEVLIGEGSQASFAAAVGLYRDRLLADIGIPEEAWTEWLDVRRQRLEGLALDAMVKLGEQELEAGNNEPALSAANRAIAISGLREDAHRLIMRVLAAGGRRADALKHYEDLAALLKRELTVEPDPTTRALAAELRKSHAARPGSEVGSDPASETGAALLPLPDRPSIAVLPFANMSGDPEQEYFADGMVDDILMALSRVRWLFVIARQSSFIYKVRVADVQQIGRELGVRYVVEGSVRKSGNRVRIVAQVIETEGGAHIWADRYEGDLRDIFALQDEITERIVSAIEPTVRTVEIKRALAKPTGSLTAYDSYLRALPYYYSQTREAVLRAETLLQEAIDLDPGYAEALGSLADCIAIRTSTGWHASWRRGTDEACEAARRALAAGPDNSTCLASAAFAYGILGHRFDEALELAERAIQVHPNSTFVRNRAGAVYSVSGESDKAIAQFEAAQRMNPLDNKTATVTFTVATTAHFFARRFEESVRLGRRTMAITPDANIARWIAAAALGHLGRLDEAQVEINKILAQHPVATLARARRASLRYDWMYDLYLDGLRKAGLPEA
jgi:TolB-like protein/Tfp pilus assembly protein PilF